jgi:hypothetical protein
MHSRLLIDIWDSMMALRHLRYLVAVAEELSVRCLPRSEPGAQFRFAVATVEGTGAPVVAGFLAVLGAIEAR